MLHTKPAALLKNMTPEQNVVWTDLDKEAHDPPQTSLLSTSLQLPQHPHTPISFRGHAALVHLGSAAVVYSGTKCLKKS